MHTNSSFRVSIQQIIQRRWKTYHVALKEKSDLSHAVSEAEKIVGYPTSFLNLRWLLTDELAHVASHFRKLIGTNHPLLKTARKRFFGTSSPAWGLIVLLMSKVGGLNANFSDNEKDATAGVLHTQRALAEVTEMLRTSNLIHKSMLNIDASMKDDILELNFGNKISLLSGDYLLSKSFYELAHLRNHDVTGLMASAVRDLVDEEFMGPRDCQERPFPSKPENFYKVIEIADQFGTDPYSVNEVLGNPTAEWTLRNILGGASLLGKSCQCTLKFANHSEHGQELGYLFGKNVALAWQAKVDQEEFVPGESGTFSLVCAPVMLHLQFDPSLYEKIEKGRENILDVDFNDLRNIIKDGPGIEGAKKLQNEFSCEAVTVLRKFPLSDARAALENIINTMLLQDQYGLS